MGFVIKVVRTLKSLSLQSSVIGHQYSITDSKEGLDSKDIYN